MKYVVTGSSGFIGKYLTKRLSEIGEEVVPLDFESGYDLTDWGNLEGLPSFDILIHLAANLFVPASYKKPRKFYHDNMLSTLNALELCRINGARLIYASSYVYGDPDFLPIDEDHPVKASNPYMQTKIIGEKLCEGYHRDFNVPIIILRSFNIVGAGQNQNFLIPEIIRQMKLGKVVLKDPRPKRDFVYIDDVVHAFIAAARYRKSDYEVFNIGNGNSYSVQEVIEFLIKLSKDKFTVHYTNEYRPNEILNTVADISKAENLLNWKPKVSLEIALLRILENQEPHSLKDVSSTKG